MKDFGHYILSQLFETKDIRNKYEGFSVFFSPTYGFPLINLSSRYAGYAINYIGLWSDGIIINIDDNESQKEIDLDFTLNYARHSF